MPLVPPMIKMVLGEDIFGLPNEVFGVLLELCSMKLIDCYRKTNWNVTE